MRNTFTNDLILFFILSLPISQPPLVDASLLVQHYTLGQWTSNKQLTWEEAWQSCRSIDHDYKPYHWNLAIMRNQDDFKRVEQLCARLTYPNATCWIGLHKLDTDLNVWKWVNHQTYDTMNWASEEPDTDDRFVRIMGDKLYGEHCASCSFSYVCQLDNLILVKENKTWEEALDHCRALQVYKWRRWENGYMFDLLSFHTEVESSYAQSIVREAKTDEVWIGLRLLAGRWLWMDGKTDDGVSSPVCPANGMNCGTLSEKGKQARSCVERRNFFCFQRPALEL